MTRCVHESSHYVLVPVPLPVPQPSPYTATHPNLDISGIDNYVYETRRFDRPWDGLKHAAFAKTCQSVVRGSGNILTYSQDMRP